MSTMQNNSNSSTSFPMLRDSLQTTLSDVLLELDRENATAASGTNFLPVTTPTPFSLGHTTTHSPVVMAPLPSSLNGNNSLLLAMAAASHQNQALLLEQAKAALLQKQLILEEQRKQVIALHRAEEQRKLQAIKPVPKPTPPVAEKALEILGTSLRNSADPYIDVSRIEPTRTAAQDETEARVPRRARGGVTDPFPSKLHRMVSDEQHSKIVSFLPHGRAFLVHDLEAFVAKVMPLYFRQSKWTSFARQLSLYGFQRINSGPDAGAYYHELFLRGRPQLVDHMRRVGVPQGQDRRKQRTSTKNRAEPNFYHMAALH